MKRLLMSFVVLAATVMCVTLTSCNKEDEVTEISGNYLLLDVYDNFEVINFQKDGSLSSTGFYGKKSGEEICSWNDVKGSYEIDGNIIDMKFEDGDNAKGSFILSDEEFVITNDYDKKTYVYKKLIETDKKNIVGKWVCYNLSSICDPKEEYINLPGGMPPFPVENIDGSLIGDIVNNVFGNITFKENGEFVFKFDYDKEEKGTYVNDNNLPLSMTFNINGNPVEVGCRLVQNVSKTESYIFVGKADVLKLAMSYIYQQLLANNITVTQEELTAFYNEMLNAFNEFAIAVSLQRQ